MLNKNKIKSNFKKSITTYNDNAFVQKTMAQKLIQKINQKKFKNILEIGSYSGILTKEIIKNFEFESYLALDIIDSFEYIKNLSPKIKFQIQDIETFEFIEQYDLIISSATLQWCNDFIGILKKLKDSSKTLAISVFGQDNLKEIKDIFNLGLNYPSIDEIKENLGNVRVYSEIKTLKFEKSIDILKHLKLTGVNSISQTPLNYKKIKQSLKKLEEKYENTITYNPLYIISVNFN